MARINNSKILDTLNQLQTLIENQGKVLQSLDSRVSALEGKTPTKSTAKRSPKTSTKSTAEFDRDLYEKLAKKNGCFAHGKVVATVKDGKVIRTAKENRQIIYKAMGLTK